MKKQNTQRMYFTFDNMTYNISFLFLINHFQGVYSRC